MGLGEGYLRPGWAPRALRGWRSGQCERMGGFPDFCDYPGKTNGMRMTMTNRDSAPPRPALSR
eukprot:2012986-Prymnesium_polylepis.1